MGTACVVDMAWSTKSIGQNNSLVAAQILIECQFTKLEAGVTNNLLSYHKEGILKATFTSVVLLSNNCSTFNLETISSDVSSSRAASTDGAFVSFKNIKLFLGVQHLCVRY
jgi:hypothetical protein